MPILAGIAAGYLPWFLYPERTTFTFYAVSFEPFLVLALRIAWAWCSDRRTDPCMAPRSGLYLVALFVSVRRAAVRVFLPVWTAEIISYQDWRFRMWMPSWI